MNIPVQVLKEPISKQGNIRDSSFIPQSGAFLACNEMILENKPCDACPSNPKNGGSGVCHCTLGSNVTY